MSSGDLLLGTLPNS